MSKLAGVVSLSYKEYQRSCRRRGQYWELRTSLLWSMLLLFTLVVVANGLKTSIFAAVFGGQGGARIWMYNDGYRTLNDFAEASTASTLAGKAQFFPFSEQLLLNPVGWIERPDDPLWVFKGRETLAQDWLQRHLIPLAGDLAPTFFANPNAPGLILALHTIPAIDWSAQAERLPAGLTELHEYYAMLQDLAQDPTFLQALDCGRLAEQYTDGAVQRIPAFARWQAFVQSRPRLVPGLFIEPQRWLPIHWVVTIPLPADYHYLIGLPVSRAIKAQEGRPGFALNLGQAYERILVQIGDDGMIADGRLDSILACFAADADLDLQAGRLSVHAPYLQDDLLSQCAALDAEHLVYGNRQPLDLPTSATLQNTILSQADVYLPHYKYLERLLPAIEQEYGLLLPEEQAAALAKVSYLSRVVDEMFRVIGLIVIVYFGYQVYFTLRNLIRQRLPEIGLLQAYNVRAREIILGAWASSGMAWLSALGRVGFIVGGLYLGLRVIDWLASHWHRYGQGDQALACPTHTLSLKGWADFLTPDIIGWGLLLAIVVLAMLVTIQLFLLRQLALTRQPIENIGEMD